MVSNAIEICTAVGSDLGNYALPDNPIVRAQMKPGAVVRAWAEAFNRADVEALGGFYAEDAVNHQVANEPVVGRAAIHRMFAEDQGRDALHS